MQNYWPTGTIYGTLLNFSAEFDSLRAQMDAPPYKAPPVAPVLYIKTANTWSASGATVTLPGGATHAEIGATVGMVMGDAGTVAGFALFNDFSLPHSSFFRPPVKFKCPDGFLGVGAQMLAPEQAGDPLAFVLEVRVNEALVQTVYFANMRCSAQQLLAELSQFMTLRKGDVLLLGCDGAPDGKRPLAVAGDRITISATGFGTLVNTIATSIQGTP